ncbi:MAG: NUDIX hydrolase [Chloroflexi bacterium]|nr:NUDIX hydrolase [Chloroflexota bacterium]
MKTWKTIDRRTVLDRGRFLVVEEHTIQLPDGRILPDWPWIITPDYVNVVAVTEEGEFLCFRQTKYAIGKPGLAPVGGYIEPDEEPLTAARRELLEETGYESADWTALGSYAVDGNRGAGVAHFFLAHRARRVREPLSDDLEEQELLRLSREELEQALADGEFRVLGWAAAVALCLLRLSTVDR